MVKKQKNFFSRATDACKKGTVATLCITLILLFAAASCEKPVKSEPSSKNSPQDTIFNMKCYVIGCDACSPPTLADNFIKWKGYLLVSEDLQDTLRTYSLPDTVFYFPVGCAEAGYTGFIYFKPQYRYSFVMNISYKFLPQNKYEDYACLTYLPMHAFTPNAMRQIQILSCENINQK